MATYLARQCGRRADCSLPHSARFVLSPIPDTPVIVAAVDDRLDGRGFIRPGLGDAGDRQFNTL
jgi:uracil phosphoribosyltransferase